MRSFVGILVGAVLLLVSGTALAAPDGETNKDGSEKSHEEVLRADLGKFWGAKRQVSVVQRRMYTKDSRFEITPFSGVIPNDDFNVYYPSGLRLGYHLSESFSVEISGTIAPDVASDLGSFLENKVGLERVELQQYFDSFYTANVLWAPAYGKISLLGTKLTHFETYLGVGIGMFSTLAIPANNPDGVEEFKPSGNTVLGFRWFISDMFSLRTEYRQHFFEKEGGGGGISIPVEFSFGLGIMI